jgi:UDP-2,3-diacylglucosamine pyrophosphatase LpxH
MSPLVDMLIDPIDTNVQYAPISVEQATQVTYLPWSVISKDLRTSLVVQGDGPPVFCVSDLHAGDGSPRDNFAVGDKLKQFLAFLDYVESQNGQLIILGDLFEFWQANVSKVVMRHLTLLDRLAKMKACYVVGNHDADLLHFCGTRILGHPFFNQMTPACDAVVGGKRFKLVHGHQADPYCASDTPGKGRISAIYSGLWEDRHGSPWINKYETVEEATVGRVERLLSMIHRLLGRADRFKAMNQRLRTLYPEYDVIISGHTHRAGAVQPRLFNTGTWAERVNSFVRITPEGEAGVFDWVEGRAVPNTTKLPC